MTKFITYSTQETQDLAQNLAKKYQNGSVVALIGDLGAGKTTFTQGFAKGLGITQKLLSPTFVLMRQYRIPGNRNMLLHIDLYRLDEIDQIQQLGIQEIIDNQDNIVLIEWADKLGSLLPKNAVKIKINLIKEDQREITISD